MKVRDLKVGHSLHGKMPGEKKPHHRVVTSVLVRTGVTKFRTVDRNNAQYPSGKRYTDPRIGGEIWELPSDAPLVLT